VKGSCSSNRVSPTIITIRNCRGTIHLRAPGLENTKKGARLLIENQLAAELLDETPGMAYAGRLYHEFQ